MPPTAVLAQMQKGQRGAAVGFCRSTDKVFPYYVYTMYNIFATVYVKLFKLNFYANHCPI